MREAGRVRVVWGFAVRVRVCVCAEVQARLLPMTQEEARALEGRDVAAAAD